MSDFGCFLDGHLLDINEVLVLVGAKERIHPGPGNSFRCCQRTEMLGTFTGRSAFLMLRED